MATVEQGITDYIASSSDGAFLTWEFMRFGSRSLADGTLRKLVADETLFWAGYEVYAPSRTFTSGPFSGRKAEKLSCRRRLFGENGRGSTTRKLVREYYERHATQVPPLVTVDVG